MTVSAVRDRTALGDYVAIGLSLTCAAHCLALPLAAAFLPMLGAWSDAEWVHWAFVLVAAPVSIWTLAWPPRGGLSLFPAVLAALGLVALVAGVAEWPTGLGETEMTLIGAVFISGAHLFNLRRRLHRHPRAA